jgi:hypothetical protein
MEAPKHPGGRPTKYDPKYCEDIINHFDVEPFDEIIDKDGNVIGTKPARFPTFERYARKIKVHTDTLIEWTKVHPEFSVAYKKAHNLQFAVYQEGVMQGAWQQAFAIFLGKNIFKLTDKQDIHNTVDLGGKVTIKIVTKNKE